MDTAELIREARDGRSSAQKCLFDLFAGKMMSVCMRYLKIREDAEDTLQEGFYKFFTKMEGYHYQGEAALYQWLKKIMINECLMLLRKKNLFAVSIDAATEDVPFPDSAFDALSAAEIMQLILELPPGYRTVFNLYIIEGMSHQEIAVLLGISEGTSKSQLSKAKAVLQKRIVQNEITHARRKTT